MCGICCFYGKHIRQYNVIMNQWIEISHTQKKKRMGRRKWFYTCTCSGSTDPNSSHEYFSEVMVNVNDL